MFRSPADKSFLRRMAVVIMLAECAVVAACYLIFGAPYWPMMAIWSGAAVFAAIVGFSALFSPDYNIFSPWPSWLPRPLPPRGAEYPGYGPHEDPKVRLVRRREAVERMARDQDAAEQLGLADTRKNGHTAGHPVKSATLIWVFGPLLAVVLIFALLLWGGIEAPG